MNFKPNRRHFLQSSGKLAAGVALASLGGWQSRIFASQELLPAPGVPNAEKLGWRVGVQIWSFSRFTLFEAVDMTAALGLKYIETYPGQRISKEEPAKFNASSPAHLRELVRHKIASAGLKHVSHYENGRSMKNLLAFCKEMGAEMLICDPKREDEKGNRFLDESFPEIDRLCQDMQVGIALANHPKPTPYWKPELVLEECEGLSPWIGGSADFGHWMREDIKPMEGVKAFQNAGRLKHFHFRERNQYGREGHDVPLGKGIAGIREILKEVHRAKLKPLFQLEHEYHMDDPMPDMIQSVKFFDEVCGELLAQG